MSRPIYSERARPRLVRLYKTEHFRRKWSNLLRDMRHHERWGRPTCSVARFPALSQRKSLGAVQPGLRAARANVIDPDRDEGATASHALSVKIRAVFRYPACVSDPTRPPTAPSTTPPVTA